MMAFGYVGICWILGMFRDISCPCRKSDDPEDILELVDLNNHINPAMPAEPVEPAEPAEPTESDKHAEPDE